MQSLQFLHSTRQRKSDSGDSNNNNHVSKRLPTATQQTQQSHIITYVVHLCWRTHVSPCAPSSVFDACSGLLSPACVGITIYYNFLKEKKRVRVFFLLAIDIF